MPSTREMCAIVQWLQSHAAFNGKLGAFISVGFAVI